MQQIEAAMLRVGQERARQAEIMGKSLQSLRMEIGGLLQDMILDDDSQHRKIKEASHRPACICRTPQTLLG